MDVPHPQKYPFTNLKITFSGNRKIKDDNASLSVFSYIYVSLPPSPSL
jgi:hypothetical protein